MEVVKLLVLISTVKNFNFYVLTNPFLDHSTKEETITMYCRQKNAIRVIFRCIHRYKRSKMKPVNTTDLSCIPFTEYLPSLYFEMMIDKKLYLFKHSDVYNLIEMCLTNYDEYMISTPLSIKNPYTGIKFSKNILYLFFLKLKHIPLLFRFFMKCNFNLNKFLLNYEGLLRGYAIEKSISIMNTETLRASITSMIQNVLIYNFSTGFQEPILNVSEIPDLLPLKPLLVYYYYDLYSLNPYQKYQYHKKLIKALIELRKTMTTSDFGGLVYIS
jgi:hypothetical protein